MEIKDLKNKDKKDKQIYKVRVLPPPRYLTIKSIKREYSIEEKQYVSPINFKLSELGVEKYKTIVYRKDSLRYDKSIKETEVTEIRDQIEYSKFSLVGEMARYLNVSPLLLSKIISEADDGEETILRFVNDYNEILHDIIIPKIFHTLYDVKFEIISEDKKLELLKEPKDAGYYEFKGTPELVIKNTDASIRELVDRSFHADTYCFDSKPEKECFLQYLTNKDKVDEIYFTGMFTSNQGDLSIQYIDPESGRIRSYYPDFLAKMTDGKYQLIEVKGDNKIDDINVIAKADAAREIATESEMEYIIYAGSKLMTSNVLDEVETANQSTLC